MSESAVTTLARHAARVLGAGYVPQLAAAAETIGLVYAGQRIVMEETARMILAAAAVSPRG